MEKIRKSANNIMWVQHWIKSVNHSSKDYEIYAEKYDESRWICEIELPLINKKVRSISDKEVSVLLNASNKAAKLINEYMKTHRDLNVTNAFKNKRWEIVSDDNGNFISLGMSSKWKKRLGRQTQKKVELSAVTIAKALEKINKINNVTEGLFVKAYDVKLFGNKTREEIDKQVYEMTSKEYSESLNTCSISVSDDFVIVVGYAKVKESIDDEKSELC